MRTKEDKLLEHILYLARRFDKKDIRRTVIMILLELGIPTQCEGFECVVNAIILSARDPTLVAIMGVYAAVAQKHQWSVKTKQVEQAIRRAIDLAWFDRDDEVWKRYFPPTPSGKYERPHNLVFISKIARVVELWTGCRDYYQDRDHTEVAAK